METVGPRGQQCREDIIRLHNWEGHLKENGELDFIAEYAKKEKSIHCWMARRLREGDPFGAEFYNDGKVLLQYRTFSGKKQLVMRRAKDASVETEPGWGDGEYRFERWWFLPQWLPTGSETLDDGVTPAPRCAPIRLVKRLPEGEPGLLPPDPRWKAELETVIGGIIRALSPGSSNAGRVTAAQLQEWKDFLIRAQGWYKDDFLETDHVDGLMSTVAALAAKGRGLAGDATEEDGELAERSWTCTGREL